MTEMPQEQRAVLEDFGVVKPTKYPKLDALLKEIVSRDGAVTRFTYDSRNGCAASVRLQGNSFDALNDDPTAAVAEAFIQALQAEPRQAGLFDEVVPA